MTWKASGPGCRSARMQVGRCGHVPASDHKRLRYAVRSGTQRARRLLSRTTVGPWRPDPRHCPASYALRGCSGALLAHSEPAPASCSQVAAGGDRWLLMAVRGHLGDTPYCVGQVLGGVVGERGDWMHANAGSAQESDRAMAPIMWLMGRELDGTLSPNPHYYEIRGRAAEIARALGSPPARRSTCSWGCSTTAVGPCSVHVRPG